MPSGDHIDVSHLRAELGPALRTVAVGDLDSREYEILHMRSDVADQYTTETQDSIFEDIVFEYLGFPAREDAFEPLGDLKFTIRSFEEGNIVMCWDDGILVFLSLDPSEHFVPPAMRLLEEQLDCWPNA